jgi:tetratricopeptide (TPR) repeat protein
MTRPAVPQPPAVEQLGALAPEIADLVRHERQQVVEAPRNASSWGRFAMACEANGLPGAARDAYAVAATLEPSQAKWTFHRARVDGRLGQVDEAVRGMRRAIEIDPRFAPAYWRLGLLLLDQNHLDDAQRALTHATELDSADRAGWLGLARVFLQRGDAAKAAQILERLAASGQADPYTLQLLGTAYRRLGRGDESASALAIGVRGEPQWNDPWTDEMLAFRRGYAALLKEATANIVAGQFPPAIRILEQLRREKPNDVVLLAHLGQVYVAAGDDASGVPLLEQVVAVAPERFEALVDLATGYMHQNNLADARSIVDRAISINPSYAPAYETLGLVLWRGGDSRAAIAAFDDAVRRDPRNTRALVWMGMVYTNMDKPAEAVAAFQRATKADPTNVDAWIGIANGEMNRRDMNAASAALQQAQRLQPDRPAVKQTTDRLQSMQRAR